MLELIQSLLLSLCQIFFQPAVLFIIAVLLIAYLLENKKYKAGAYYKATRIPLLFLRRDLGKYGEYLTYKQLKQFEKGDAKFLFNVYLPKENDETTEIDVLMLSKYGIFVFESKNYSGWIFGNENQKNWYQTLPAGKNRSHKEQFFNPVMQNRTHIKYLSALLETNFPLYSIIVFSERCTLKGITIESPDIHVIKRDHVFSVVSKICKNVSEYPLTEERISQLYDELYPYTQVSDKEKLQHIANIKTNLYAAETKKTTIKETAVSIAALDTNTESDELSNEQTEPVNTNQTNSSTDIQVCSRCGATLVLRTATKGKNAGNQFWSCSNFPKCRYIKN